MPAVPRRVRFGEERKSYTFLPYDERWGAHYSSTKPLNKEVGPSKKSLLRIVLREWKAFLAGLAIVYGGTILNRMHETRSYLPLAQKKMAITQGAERWPDNTAVYSSVIQEQNAWGLNGGYTLQLMSRLDRPEVDSLHSAHTPLELDGLSGFTQFVGQVPVSSTRGSQGWRKSDTAVPRTVLIITGAPTNKLDSWLFLRQSEGLKETLQKHYHIPNERIIHLQTPTPELLEQTLASLSKPESKDAELLVYIQSHGSLFNEFGKNDTAGSAPQGQKDGYLWVYPQGRSLSKTVMKSLFSRYLSGYRDVSLILEACHSGAWIAQAPVKGENLLYQA